MGTWSERLLKLGGSVVFFIGSLLFAVTTWAGNAVGVFLLFLIGHACWCTAGLVMRDRGTFLSNAMYLGFDISAVLIRL